MEARPLVRVNALCALQCCGIDCWSWVHLFFAADVLDYNSNNKWLCSREQFALIPSVWLLWQQIFCVWNIDVLLVLVMERRMLVLLEEIKVQNQTQILLLQQLVSSQSAQQETTTGIQDEIGLPLTSLQQVLQLEADCTDRDVKAKLVSIKCLVLCKNFAIVISCYQYSEYINTQ